MIAFELQVEQDVVEVQVAQLIGQKSQVGMAFTTYPVLQVEQYSTFEADTAQVVHRPVHAVFGVLILMWDNNK